MFGKQIDALFEALSKNKGLQYLNLAMTSLHKDQDLLPLKRFIRKNTNLMHLDFSGMFKTAAQVKGIVKAIKKHRTLLAVHLSYIPFLRQDKRL